MTELKGIKPVLALTMGDPAGIGPEIAVRALADPGIRARASLILIGNTGEMEKALKLTGSDMTLQVISDLREASFEAGTIDLFHLESPIKDEIHPGELSARAGDLAFRSVHKAIELAMEKKVDGTVTGPINKEALNLAGHKFAGHTEIYAHYTGTEKYAMLLAEEHIRVIHVSTHVSLREACNLVKKERILDVIRLLDEALRKMGLTRPFLGVAGLNPHSGDGGLFGFEEEKEIIPAIKEARSSGMNVEGPVPADTLFALARGGHYDGCVAMYHDQGHIPFKVLGFEWDEESKRMKDVGGVNISLGLPIVRTSVDHGTAFQIAGKGIASPTALLNAIEYAVKMLAVKSNLSP